MAAEKLYGAEWGGASTVTQAVDGPTPEPT